MNNVILTGFEPFGSYDFNPTQDSALFFNGKQIGDKNIIGLVLPCTYYGAFDILKNAITKYSPDAIVSVGLSSNVKGIRFEQVGRNILNGKYPDANGVLPTGDELDVRGKYMYNVNSDFQRLSDILEHEHIRTEISNNAEGFICNSLLYFTSQYVHQNNLSIKNAFIHVPWTDNYGSKLNLDSQKIMISKDELDKSIELIIKSI